MRKPQIDIRVRQTGVSETEARILSDRFFKQALRLLKLLGLGEFRREVETSSKISFVCLWVHRVRRVKTGLQLWS